VSRGVFARGASELYLRASSHCVKNGPVNMIQIHPNHPFDLNEMFNLCSIVKGQEMTREGLEFQNFQTQELQITTAYVSHVMFVLSRIGKAVALWILMAPPYGAPTALVGLFPRRLGFPDDVLPQFNQCLQKSKNSKVNEENMRKHYPQLKILSKFFSCLKWFMVPLSHRFWGFG